MLHDQKPNSQIRVKSCTDLSRIQRVRNAVLQAKRMTVR